MPPPQNRQWIGFVPGPADLLNLLGYFENIKSANIEELKGFIGKLEKRLTPISANGKTHSDVKARYEKIEALKKKIGETTEGDGQAPKPPEAKKAPPVASAKPLGYADKRNVSYFDKDYQRYKGDFDRLDPSRYDHLKKLIANLHKRLDPISAAARAHPEVQKRKKILAELQARFDQAFPGGKPAVATAQQAKPVNKSDEPHLKAFDERMKRYTRAFEEMDPKDQLAIRQTLQEIADPLGKVSFHGRKHPEYLKRRAQHDELQKKVNNAFGEIKPLDQNQEKLLGEFRAIFNKRSYAVGQDLNPISLQDPKVRKRAEKNLAELEKPLLQIGESNHPRVLAERMRLVELRNRFEAGIASSKQAEEQAGDVDGQLDLIQKQFPMKAFNPAIKEPCSPEQVEDWARKLKNWQSAVDEAVKFFRHAEKTSIKARSKEFGTYAYWFERNVKGLISGAIAHAKSKWESPIHQGLHPNLSEQAMNNPAKVKWNLEVIDKGIYGATRLLAFGRGYDAKEDPELVKKIATMHELKGKVHGGAEEMVKKNRLPKPATTDPELLAIAKKALAESTMYKFGPIKRVVINYDKHSAREGEFWDGYFYIYDWDEFQVTFAVKEDGEWWVRTAMIKYYRVGYKVQKNIWQVVKSMRWNRILEENIDK